MEYSKIIAITGLTGLFELVSSKSDGGIVRSLDDNSTRFVSSRVHQFSHLESIEVYTTRHNVNLVDVLKAMESNTEKLPDEKNSAALKSYFEKVYPELDFDRVYTSDLKKMVKWFSVLSNNKIEIKLSEAALEAGNEDDPEEVPVSETSKTVAPKATKKEVKADIKADAADASQKAKKPAEAKPVIAKAAEVKTAESKTKPAEEKTAKKPADKKESPEEKPAKKTAEKKDAEPKAPAKKPVAKSADEKPVAKKK